MQAGLADRFLWPVKLAVLVLAVDAAVADGNDSGADRIKEKPIPKGRVFIGVGTRTAERPAARSTILLREFAPVGNRCR